MMDIRVIKAMAELEADNETSMDNVDPHAVLEIINRLEKAEAQLAELAKKEPFAYWKPDHFGPVFRQGKGYALTDKRYKPLFEQPVPPEPVKLPEPIYSEDGEPWLYRDEVIEAIEEAGGSVADE